MDLFATFTKPHGTFVIINNLTHNLLTSIYVEIITGAKYRRHEAPAHEAPAHESESESMFSKTESAYSVL